MSRPHGAIVALLLVACTSASEPRGAAPPAPAPRAPLGPIDALIASMTIEEKAGQLTQWSAQPTPTGPRVRQGGEDDIRLGRVGSFLGAYGAELTQRLQRIAVEESRL